MKYLLDTAVFLRVIFDELDLLSKTALNILQASSTDLILSAASSWEIAIKFKIGRLELKKEPAILIPKLILKMGLQSLPITHRHATDVAKLPLHHKDPFDRLLIAQAKQEQLVVLTPDKIFKKYRVKTAW